jgi:hypothetical protein
MLGNLVLTGSLIALIVLLDRHVLGWFLPGGSPSLEVARHLNHIAIGSFLFFGVTFVLAGVVRSTGAVMAPVLILAIAMWGIRVPVARWLQPVMGVDAIWWSFPISSVCSMLMMLAYYRWGNWRKAHMLPARQASRQSQPPESENTSVDADALLNNASNCERIVMPAEVGGQPPSPWPIRPRLWTSPEAA